MIPGTLFRFVFPTEASFIWQYVGPSQRYASGMGHDIIRILPPDPEPYWTLDVSPDKVIVYTNFKTKLKALL